MEKLRAYQAIRLNIEDLQVVRQNADCGFSKIFVESKAMGEKFGTMIKPKHRCGRQANRDNDEGSPENYFSNLILSP